MRKFSPLTLALSLTLVLTLVTGCSASKSGQKSGEDLNGLQENDLNAAQESRFGAGSIPTAEGEGMFRDIYFNYDSAEVSSENLQSAEYNANVLKQNHSLKIQLEGHCDERGTAEYNLALGSRRARAVYDLMVSYGIPRSQLDTISYGEEVPLDPNHDESAYAKNRRVHFSAYQEARGR